MGVSADENAAHGDEDHGLGDVDALLVVAHETSPARHPCEGSLDHPASVQYLEARFGVEAANDLDEEALERRLVHELAAVVGPIGEEMLDPGPARSDGVEDHLGPGGVRYVGGRYRRTAA